MEIKHLIPYFLKSKTKVIVPYKRIRNILGQNELSEKTTHASKNLKQYDYDIKLDEIVRGQGLCKWVTKIFNSLDNDSYLKMKFSFKMKFHVF